MKYAQATRGDHTRHEILVAAKVLFVARGYTATTVRQVAAAAGITPAAIYNYFAGKDEIFSALLLSLAPHNQLFELVRQLDADSAEGLVQQIFQRLLPFMAGHEDYVRLAMIDTQERNGAALASLVPAVLPHAMELHQRLVTLDDPTGRLKQLPFPVFMRSLISLLVGFTVTGVVATQTHALHIPDANWASALADIFLYGVLSSPRSVEA